MIRFLRQLIILSAALAFMVTSVGWGVAGALKTLNPHYENQFGLTKKHTADHHHHDEDQVAQYDHDHSCSSETQCSKNAPHEHPGGSCCASDCHIATSAVVTAQALRPLIMSLHSFPLDEDTRGATSARLERPPKLLAA